MVRAILPTATVLTEPSRSSPDDTGVPTRARVLSHLPGCSIAHFARHGESDPSDPFRSRLLLHDRASAPLTVASPATVDHDQLQLVPVGLPYRLQRRGTAGRGHHLTSAFQLASSRHVVGTLWDIGDAVAADIGATFYTRPRTSTGIIDTNRAAFALHHAVRAVRDRFPYTPSLWASHLHGGA
jgi:CHAT domain-containing protein